MSAAAPFDLINGLPRDIGLLRDEIARAYSFDPDYSQGAAARVWTEWHRPRARFVVERGHWAVWDAGRWSTGAAADAAAFRAMHHFCTGLAHVALRDETLGRAANNTARGIASEPFIRRALDIAESHCGISASEFDADPWLLNTPGGIVDLRTGELRPARPEDLCMRMTAVAPDFDASAERFSRFLREVFERVPDDGEREELIEFTLATLGYCLTGDTAIHALFFWHGEGRNGKNVLGELVTTVMGDYARKISNDVLMAAATERHPAEIAQLKGVRLAVASEVNENAYWNEARIKELTGDDRLNARFMRQDFFEFPRTHKLLVYGNNKPRLRVVDAAIKSRLRMTEFGVNFVAEGRADPGLPEALRAEAGAVLAMLVRAAASVWRAGRRLPPCRFVDRASGDYTTEQDTLGEWIEEHCEPDPGARSRPSDLYADFAAWKVARGERTESMVRWRALLDRRPGLRFYKSNGVRYVEGLRLRT